MFRYLVLSSVLLILLLVGCSPERKLARNYVKNHKGNGVLIVPLYELYKDNLSISFDTAVKYSPEQFDSIAWAQSCYIQHISDSLYLTSFTNSMINQLTVNGYDVYVDGSSDVFLSLPDPKWVVQIAQLQLNEEHSQNYYEMYSVETGEPFTEGLRINQVSLNSWLEVSRANTTNKQVLYLSGYIQDDIKRGINISLMEGSVGLEQIRDSMKVNDVYRMASDMGQKHADMLFDYFMNDYIRDNLPAGIVNRQYFHFDRKSNSLKSGLKERFEVVK
ncbi:MAG: hypothetical protein Q7U54_19145 [Bacteroidales bacterium]|nr:hypothetical protein [Bacteroidales bacterium]